MFYGLGCLVKFPQTTIEAPYTLCAAGVQLPPQRFQLPFSLLARAEVDPNPDYAAAEGRRPIGRDAPRCLPAWVLRYSWYTVMRNEHKFESRTKIKPASGVVARVVRERTVQLCLGAREMLAGALTARALHPLPLTDGAVLCGEEVAGLGGSWCTVRDARMAIAAYTQLGRLLAMRTLLEHLLSLAERSTAGEVADRTTQSVARPYSAAQCRPVPRPFGPQLRGAYVEVARPRSATDRGCFRLCVCSRRRRRRSARDTSTLIWPCCARRRCCQGRPSRQRQKEPAH